MCVEVICATCTSERVHDRFGNAYVINSLPGGSSSRLPPLSFGPFSIFDIFEI